MGTRHWRAKYGPFPAYPECPVDLVPLTLPEMVQPLPSVLTATPIWLDMVLL